MPSDIAILDQLVACLNAKAKADNVKFCLVFTDYYGRRRLELIAKSANSISSVYASRGKYEYEYSLEASDGYDDLLKLKLLDEFIMSKGKTLNFTTSDRSKYWHSIDVADLESSSREELALKLAMRGAE